MTLINLTIARGGSCAIMSVDAAVEGAAPGHGRSMSKLKALSHVRAIVAGSGMSALVTDIYNQLAFTPDAVRDFESLLPSIPAMMRETASGYPDPHVNLFSAAWARGRAMGWVFLHERAFEPLPIESGNVGAPPLDQAPPHLSAAATAAAQGKNPERYHRLALAAQTRGCREGRYGADRLAGGPFTIARLDADGISLTTIDDLGG